MKVHTIAMDILLDLRDEAAHWSSGDLGDGRTIIRRDKLLEGLTEDPATATLEQHILKTEQAQDFILLIALSLALEKAKLV